jgi:hypothetical protein
LRAGKAVPSSGYCVVNGAGKVFFVGEWVFWVGLKKQKKNLQVFKIPLYLYKQHYLIFIPLIKPLFYRAA